MNYTKLFLQSFLFLFLVVDRLCSETTAPTLDQWIHACLKLPKNRELAIDNHVIHSDFVFNWSSEEYWKQFESVLDEYLQNKISSSLALPRHWEIDNRGNKLPPNEFFDIEKNENQFFPFVEKHRAQTGECFLVRGDLHGDIASLATQLKNMKESGKIDDNFILKRDFNMIFLGDYVDRGQYGVEVLYTILRLMNANPHQVFAVRGNHEDIHIQKYYGFQREIDNKFGDPLGNKHKKVGRMYRYLPVALFLGDEGGRYMQCCHGGIEQGYNPHALLIGDKRFQLLGTLHRRKAVNTILDNETINKRVKNALHSIISLMHDNVYLSRPAPRNQLPLGFMWNDFDTFNNDAVKHVPGRGLCYGKDAVEAVLHPLLIGIMRAHQHAPSSKNPLMQQLMRNKGVCKLWKHDEDTMHRHIGDKGEVVMFNVAPDGGVYGKAVGFDYDAAALVVPQKSGQWSMEVRNYFPFDRDAS